jgi:hypothetical protein
MLGVTHKYIDESDWVIDIATNFFNVSPDRDSNIHDVVRCHWTQFVHFCSGLLFRCSRYRREEQAEGNLERTIV